MTATDRAFIKAYDRSVAEPPQATQDHASLDRGGEPTASEEPTAARARDTRQGRPQRPAPSAESTDAESRAAKQPLSVLLAQEATSNNPQPPAASALPLTWPAECRRFLESSRREFEHLTDRLLQLARQHKQKAVAVTGLYRGEGRSGFLVALARCLCDRGARPVLIDADFLSPALAQRFGAERVRGWEEMLAGAARLDDVLLSGNGPALTILPSQERSGRAHELAASLKATITLGMLREEFDLLLIDVGPLLEQHSTATAFLNANRVDSAILLHDERNANAAVLQQARHKLQSAGVRLLGVVKNFCTDSGEGDTKSEAA